MYGARFIFGEGLEMLSDPYDVMSIKCFEMGFQQGF